MLLLSWSLLFVPLCAAAKGPGKLNPAEYAPGYVSCPSDLAVRPASSGLSTEEQSWRELRQKEVLNSLGSYLQTANISGFNVTGYLKKINASNVPIAGLAISGGGSQSGMTGLGLYQAFDARNDASVKAGTGGLLQCLSYFSGLSGGGFNTILPV
jgi:lysophospholipase